MGALGAPTPEPTLPAGLAGGSAPLSSISQQELVAGCHSSTCANTSFDVQQRPKCVVRVCTHR